VKGREIDVATDFFTGTLARIRGKVSKPGAKTSRRA